MSLTQTVAQLGGILLLGLVLYNIEQVVEHDSLLTLGGSCEFLRFGYL